MATFTELTKATYAPHAQALKIIGTVGKAGTEKFALPIEDLGLLTDKLNENNPLAFYASALPVAAVGAGSIDLKWVEEANNWKAKKDYGNAAYDDVAVDRETLYWNTPEFRAEAMLAYDIAKGADNVLPLRATRDATRFMQDAIKQGFVELASVVEDAAKYGTMVTEAPTLTGVDVQEDGAKLLLAITETATQFVIHKQLDRADVLITIQPDKFDKLAFAGLIGNRVDQTFAGGQYTVATAGGYRIQTGEMFMAGLTINDGAATAADHDVIAVIGTNRSLVFNTEIIASNFGKIDLTNDLGTYMEMASIIAVPEHIKAKEQLHFVVDA